MGKKNLDKLFHEKLKDFSEVPDDKVWQSIETSLDKKKKSRKVIPIWWKLGGVAAIVLITITLINPFENNPADAPTVTEVNSGTEKSAEENKKDRTFENQKSNEDQIVDTEQEPVSGKEDFPTDQVANTNATSKEDLKSNEAQKSSEKDRIKNQNALGVQVANLDRTEVQQTRRQDETQTSESNFDKISEETAIVESGTSKTELEKNLPKEDGRTEDNRSLIDIDATSEEGIAVEISKEDTSDGGKEAMKKSIFDEIAEQEQEEEVVAENSGSKWSAGPSIAPVYFSALGEGSPVHSIFVPNSKSGDVNLSYGLSVAYEVSKKLSIRSGVHKVDYGYRTNDVAFSSSLENATSGQLDNIDYTLTSKSLIVNSKVNTRTEAFNQDSFANAIATSEDISAASAARDGFMEQQFGYLEVPVELNYALVDNRFGINLIGGVSSLFLVDNSISLSSGELTTEVGEANNINSINFSTNVGFGLNYKFTPKVRLNIEPVFKYQLNTFSETDGTFNPFSIGVYSGLSFKF